MSYILSFEVRTGGGPPRSVLTEHANVTIGRGRAAVVQAADASLEELHSVVLQRDDGTVVVLNYARRGGTLLNGEPTNSAIVREGDVIQCGNTRVTLLERRANDAEPRKVSATALREFLGWAVRRRITR